MQPGEVEEHDRRVREEGKDQRRHFRRCREEEKKKIYIKKIAVKMEIESKYEFVCIESLSQRLMSLIAFHCVYFALIKIAIFFLYRSESSKNLLLVDKIVKLVQKVLLMSHTSTRPTHTPAHSTPG